MNHDTNDVSGDAHGGALSPAEELRFNELVDTYAQLQMTANWRERFLDMANGDTLVQELAPNSPPIADPSEEFVLDLVDLTEAPQPKRALPRVLVAAAVLLVAVLVASSLFTSQGSSTETLPLLSESARVGPPTITPLNLPDGTFSTGQAANGALLAFAETDIASGTRVYLSTDLQTWEEAASLPVSLGMSGLGTFQVSEDVWYIVGGDPNTLVPIGQGELGLLPTDLVAFSSADSGETWTEIDISLGQTTLTDSSGEQVDLPFSHRTVVPFSMGIAIVEDQVLVSYNTWIDTDWTALARSAGVVGDDTVVISRLDGDFSVVGPEGVGDIVFTAEDLGIGEEVFAELFAQGRNGEPVEVLQRSVAGEPFAPVDIPGSQILGFTLTSPFALDVFNLDEQFLLVGREGADAYVSDDGLNWTETDDSAWTELFNDSVGGEFVDTDEWSVQASAESVRFLNGTPGLNGITFIDLAASDVVVRQSVDGGPLSPVPVPDREADADLGFTTNFGGAVVWQDYDAPQIPDQSAVVEDNGYTFETSVIGNLTVTDPTGAVLVNERAMDVAPEGRVVVDAFFDIMVFDEDGRLAASTSFEELFVERIGNGGDGEEPARYISWATGPDEWQFAPLEGLDATLWFFEPTELGLIASSLVDANQSVLIEWPDQFGE